MQLNQNSEIFQNGKQNNSNLSAENQLPTSLNDIIDDAFLGDQEQLILNNTIVSENGVEDEKYEQDQVEEQQQEQELQQEQETELEQELEPEQQEPEPEPEQTQVNDNVEKALSVVSSYVGSDLTPEEEQKKKKNFLYKLKRFQKKGFTLSRPYNLDSDLVDIRAEVESIKREANLGAGVATMKKGLTITTYILESLNRQFDPINAKLDGWSNQVKDDVEHGDYDEVFEELYDKYTDKFKMPPEMKLISMLGTSALQYHIAQIVVNRTLDINKTDQILKQNPKIKQDILNAVNQSKIGEQINTQAKNFHFGNNDTSPIETPEEEQKMNDPSTDIGDIDNILKELEIEDENSKILSTDF